MNIYNKNKKHWSQVQMMGCLHMRMLKSLHVVAVFITLSLFGSFVRGFYLAMLFGSFIISVLPSRNLCFYTGDTHFYSHLSLESRPKRRQSRPTSGSQGSKCEHIGGSKNFRGGPNTSAVFGPGVQLLWGSNYYGGPNTT